MLQLQTYGMFLAAATFIAITPGPGMFYIVARTLAGGRREGLASSIGLGFGGLFHVVAGSIGVSALVMASANAFTVLKILGAFYLIWLGLKTWREANFVNSVDAPIMGSQKALYQGIVVEALNPKTATFFLAFIPQFIEPPSNVGVKFAALGMISVALNTGVDLIVSYCSSKARDTLEARPALVAKARKTSGGIMCGLGTALLIARRST